MAFTNLTKKITAVASIGMLVATPFAFADNHNTTGISTTQIENTQDLETNLESLDVAINVEEDIEIEGFDITSNIQTTIDELKDSLREHQNEVEIEISFEDGIVEVEIEGELEEDQEELVEQLRNELENIIDSLESVEDVKVEIEISTDVDIEEREDDEDEFEDDDKEEEDELDENYSLSNKIEVEGVVLTSQIRSLIDELQQSINETSVEIEIEVESDEGEVESKTDIEGEITQEQRNLISSLVRELEALVQGKEDAEVEIEIKGKYEDSNVLSTNYGAEMRFEQLKARLDARIENTQVVFATVESNLSTQEKERLETIMAEFVVLQDEMENVTAPDAQTFVAYKEEIITLSQEFRQTVRPHITIEMRVELEEQIREKQEQKLQERKEKIEELRKKINARVITQNFGNISGINVSAYSNAYINGSMSLGEVQQELREQLQTLNVEERRAIVAQAQEQRIKASINARIKTDERKEQIEQRKEEIREKVQNQRERIKDVVNTYASLPQEEREQIREQVGERIQNLSDDEISQIRRNAQQIGIDIDKKDIRRIQAQANVNVNTTIGGGQ